MNKELLIILLIIHFLMDFQLQSQDIATNKGSKMIYMLKHFVISLVFPLIFILIDFKVSILLLILAIFHILIDLIKGLLEQKLLSNSQYQHLDKIVFITDQLVHLSIIFIGLILYKGDFHQEIFSISVLKWILFIILITKPINVSFKKLFIGYQPESDINSETVIGAGSIIGNLERLLAGVFLALNQFSAIALIMTAKSIARYNKIAESPKFAEYYLIGSLYSILAVIICYQLIFYII